MSEVKDATIKLFGRTIPLPLSRELAANGSSATAASIDDCSDHSNHSFSSSPPEEESCRTEREAHGYDMQVCDIWFLTFWVEFGFEFSRW